MTHESATTVKELPEPLPRGEVILWQGRPDLRSLYRRAFHGRALAIYFALLILARGVTALALGDAPPAALVAMLWLVPLALFALGMLAVVAVLTARSTWYTITDQRVVMRIGIVLEITFNFPFKVIDTAGLHLYANGTGDIPLKFMDGEQIAYLHLWPHVRPWHLRHTEPMLRCVPDAARIAELLASAMVAATGGSALPLASSKRATMQPRPVPNHITASAA